jgi:iron complex outermembrane receptor protein
MKKLLTLIITICSYLAASAQDYGSVKGTVTSQDGSPAAYVSVGVQGLKAGTLTSEKGTYHIGKLKPGTYTINVTAVNLTPQQKEITVTGGGTVVADFVLDISNSQLQEVVVKAKANRIKADLASPTLRVETPLLELPQNVQVVTNTSLAEQQIISMSDGLIRNVSGAVRLEHWGDMYTNITMRGSQIQAFSNGFNVVTSYWGPLTEDMSVVDHIEFVKGPAGFMLSNGDPAGLYNVVTKKPTGNTKGEFSLSTGSFGFYRTTLDLDGKLTKDGKLLYRLNLAGQNKKSFRANEFNDRYTVAPVISYQIDDKTKLTAEYLYQGAVMSNVGSFYVFSPTGYATYPREFTALPAGIEPTKMNDHSFTLNLQHQIDNNWKLTAQAAYYTYNQKGSSMWLDSIYDNGTYFRNIGIWDAKSQMTLGQAFVNGTVQTGAIKHRILGGIDMGNKTYNADYNTGFALDTAGGAGFDPHNPNLGVPPNGYPDWSENRSKNIEARAAAGYGLIQQNYSSIYVQDELGFIDNRLRITLAGRYTYVNSDGTVGKKFTPRFGLSFSLNNSTSFYGLYDQAFIPQSPARLKEGGKVKPITGSNLEFGIKKDWADGKWGTTLSVYQILKNNEAQAAPESTPNNPISFILGQKKARGIEFDLRGELAPGLTLTANYALTESRVTKLGEFADPEDKTIAVGAIVPGYAKHVANSWLSYKLQSGALKGSGISAGFTYLAGRETDTWFDSDVRLPNYFKLDGGLFWEGSKMRITANVFNVLDKYLYSGSYYGYGINAFSYQAEAPRNYRLSLTYRF